MSPDEPTRILAIRHGETAWNVDGRIQGQTDIALNERGLRQARALADDWRGAPMEAITIVFSSDLQRARQTAAPLADACGARLVLDPGLRERSFGIYEGLTGAEIEARWPDDARRWRAREPHFAPPGAESLVGFASRSVASTLRLAAAHPGETIALVTHGGVLDALYRAATRVDVQAARSWKLPNAAVNRLLHTPQGLSLIGWADTQHLDGLDAGDEVDGARRD